MKQWITELGKMPDFDGQYLVFIHEIKECGNIWKFQKVMTCAFNSWFLLLTNQTVMAWKELDDNPILPKELDHKILDFIFNFYTQRELAEELNITQWELLVKIKDSSFTEQQEEKVLEIYNSLKK